MAGTLSDLEVAAALAELIYRRNSNDQALTLDDISGTNDRDVRTPDPLTKSDNFYYDDATGFVGQVVDANGKIFVVLRGTDFEGGLTGVDFTDGNLPLALGTFDNTQLDDAIALTKAAIEAANGKTVVVTGHSLGGGLAGLVSAVLGLQSYTFDPAPFAKDLPYLAAKLAWTDNGIPIDEVSVPLGEQPLNNDTNPVWDVSFALLSASNADLTQTLQKYFSEWFPDKVSAIRAPE